MVELNTMESGVSLQFRRSTLDESLMITFFHSFTTWNPIMWWFCKKLSKPRVSTKTTRWTSAKISSNKSLMKSFQNTSEIVDSMITPPPGKWSKCPLKFNGWFRCMDLKRGTTSLVFQVVGWLSIINQFGYQGSVAYEKLQANSFGQGVNRQETRWSWKRYCPLIHRQWKWLYRIIIKIVMDDKSTNKNEQMDRKSLTH